ncbi:unnamed protein product [Echinostoma caproni]|uniref:receptor protein serine/threonine kinase n=1 Tax=Echinostoma caproni TaxID=27848 RepID=A0A183B1W8_9TREM|nr:unnamed protein product [Echinostoma caproni]
MLRLLGQGRFAQVWLAKLEPSTGTDSGLDISHRSPYSDPLSDSLLLPDASQPNDSNGRSSPPNSTDTQSRLVAVKIFPAAEQRTWANEAAVFRILRSTITRSASEIDTCYHLIRLSGAGKVHNEYRLVLEYAPRGSLRDLLDRGEWYPLQLVLNLARDMVRGLCYLHADYPTVDRPSIAHRDVKPENVLIRSDGSACLSDFGQSVVLDTRLSDEVVRSDRTGPAAAATTTTMLSNNLVSCGTNFDAVPKVS